MNKELHLWECIVVMFKQNVGLPCNAGAILKDKGCADTIEAVQADFWQNGPAYTAFYHLEAGGDIIHVETGV